MAEKPRLKVPKEAKKGEVIEIKTLIAHIMESGQRKDRDGNTIPRKILKKFACTVNGKQVMSEVLALCGGRNVFGSLNDLAPQVGVEAVIATNPGAIVSTGDSGPAGLDQWRKWPQLRAVAAGNLFALPADDLSRPTLRLAQGARGMCRTLETARDRLQSEK